jgi:hypothetical protein
LLRDTTSTSSPPSHRSLREWRHKGAYFTRGSTKKVIHIEGGRADYVDAVWSEIEALLDHASEQKTSLCALLDSDVSPSWTLVTLYYWGLFSALTLTRLLGSPVAFLTKDDVATLCRAGVDPQELRGPPPGTYEFNVTSLDSVAKTWIELKYVGSNFHDTIWTRLTANLSELVRASKATADFDSRVITSLCAFSRYQASWPSTIRNAVNYQPGYSYQFVHGKDHGRIRESVIGAVSKSLSVNNIYAVFHVSKGDDRSC